MKKGSVSNQQNSVVKDLLKLISGVRLGLGVAPRMIESLFYFLIFNNIESVLRYSDNYQYFTPGDSLWAPQALKLVVW